MDRPTPTRTRRLASRLVPRPVPRLPWVPPGAADREVRVLVAVRVVNRLAAFVLPFLAVLLGPQRAVAGLAVFGATTLLSRWLGARLLDHLRPRTVVTLGLAATGVATVLLAVSPAGPLQLAAVAAVGLAFEVYEPATQEQLARAATGERRQSAYAMLGAWLAAAGAVSGLVAAVLLPFGVRWLLAVDGLAGLAAAALVVWLLRRDDDAPGGDRRTTRPAAGARRWRPTRRLLALTGAQTAFATGYLAVLMFLPLRLVSLGAPGWLPGALLATGALCAPLVVRLAARRLGGVAHRSLLGAAVSLLGALSLGLLLPVPAAAVVYLVWAVVDAAALGRWQSVVAEEAPEGERPRWFATTGLAWAFAGVAAPLAAGAVGAVPVLGGDPTSGALVLAALALVLSGTLVQPREGAAGPIEASTAPTPHGSTPAAPPATPSASAASVSTLLLSTPPTGTRPEAALAGDDLAGPGERSPDA